LHRVDDGEMNRRRPVVVGGLVVIVAAGVAALPFLRQADPPGPSTPAPSAPLPTAVGGLATVNTGGVSLTYPASWSLHVPTEIDLGMGSTSFVLSSEPFPPECEKAAADLNCFEQHPMGPGAVRIEVGQDVRQPGAFFDPFPPGLIPPGPFTRGTLAGMPDTELDQGPGPSWAFLDSWQVAMPETVQRTLAITASGTDPGSGSGRSLADQVIGTLASDQPPGAVPTGAAARAAAARAAAVEAVGFLRADQTEVFVGDDESMVLDDCFEAAVDRPVTRTFKVATMLETARHRIGTVAVTCSVSIELVGGAYWKVRFEARSEAGSSAPGTTATVIVWVSTGGADAGETSTGRIAGPRVPGLLPADPSGAVVAASLLTAYDDDATDFYHCFLPTPGTTTGSITSGPDHVRSSDVLAVTCTNEVTIAPDRRSFAFTLTAAWEAGDTHPAGRIVAHVSVGTDGLIRLRGFEGGPLP
jgi:hypothetical protein